MITPTIHKMPALGADSKMLTMSGFSGGSYMTNNLHVVHSDIIKGSSLIAGGLWYESDFMKMGAGRDVKATVEKAQ